MTVIKFQGISKRYRLGYKPINLRDAIPKFFKSREDKWLWALKNVSFEIKKGEALGIIGPNGAGKTTILKILSKITEPTEGKAEVNGRVASLIELGAGFHPDLTGKENIYLNGTIMGMSRKEVDSKYKDIVEFSELEEFINTPVKRYSSGMYLRLGFAVAIHIEPDILLIDEVLAVGDISFQLKCLKKIRELITQNKSIVFVSHNLSAVREICDKTIFILHGNIEYIGSTEESINRYYSNIISRQTGESVGEVRSWDIIGANGERIFEITDVKFMNASGEEKKEFKVGEKFIARIYYSAQERIERPVIHIAFHGIDGGVYAGHTTSIDKFNLGIISGKNFVDVEFDEFGLPPGAYYLEVGLWNEPETQSYDRCLKTFRFSVKGGKTVHGLFYMPHKWKVN